MKSSLMIAIGLLTLLLPAASAAAGCPASETARKLATMTPVGHYAQKTVERVNQGISKARGKPADAGALDRSKFHFISTMTSILYMVVDTDISAVEYSRDLTRISTCLHLDLAILEAKMDEIRCEVVAAYDRKSPDGINMLNTLADFLNQRYRHLVAGSTNPAHIDRNWPRYEHFDDPFQGWCCVLDQMQCRIQTADECTQVKDGKGGYDFFSTQDACLSRSPCSFGEDGTARPKHVEQCPFDSDYLGAAAGYGCDATVLKKIESSGGGGTGITKEIDALQELAKTRDEFLEEIDHIKDTTLSMDTFVDNTMLSSEERQQLNYFGETRTEEAEHRRVYGCNADLTPEERDEVERPEGEESNMGSEGELTPDTHPSEEWTATPARGPFFFRRDHLSIWKAFFRLQFTWVRLREFPVYLKYPDEFFKEEDRKKAMERQNPAMAGLRKYFRTLWTEFMSKQAADDAAILTKAQDTALQVREALAPVRPAMKGAVELVNKPDKGLRKFGRNYAYFLRRSCIYRPCNERLELIMKILYTDECFPYASGEFRVEEGEEVKGKTSWEKCMEAVQKL